MGKAGAEVRGAGVPEVGASAGPLDAVRDALRYCFTRARVKRAVITAVIVGTVLTLVNQVDVIVGGEATTATYLKCAGNYVVPFIVSNVGMLIGRAGP